MWEDVGDSKKSQVGVKELVWRFPGAERQIIPRVMLPHCTLEPEVSLLLGCQEHHAYLNLWWIHGVCVQRAEDAQLRLLSHVQLLTPESFHGTPLGDLYL